MAYSQDPEDVLIRRLLLGAAVAVVSGALVTALVITAMVGANFNFLNWME